MDAKIDDRSALAKLIKDMSDLDLQQMLAYAVGYEAGKRTQSFTDNAENQRNPPMQTAQLRR